ncbi:MAG: hypothetical protein FWG50_01980 [Kiritimatiellaeota bacterium]|nr:hypothetical protein [Kiritimatiellota bacterium]
MRKVEKLTDQKTLADIARNAKDEYVRKAAVEKLKDQGVLADVVQKDGDWVVIMAAVERLDDQGVLAVVAKNDGSCDMRMAAADKLDDKALAQEVYTVVAKSDADKWRRREAVLRLTNQRVLTGIANSGDMAGYRYEWRERTFDSYLGTTEYETHTLDLRDVARGRLAELKLRR